MTNPDSIFYLIRNIVALIAAGMAVREELRGNIPSAILYLCWAIFVGMK